jgi:hypothetical protein
MIITTIADYIYVSLIFGLFLIIYLALALPIFAAEWVRWRLAH